jgi:two-component system chemotaxis response regulator CheB
VTNATGARIRVLVVDDSAFARQVVRRVLERGGDIEVVGVARDGAEALEKIALTAPDVITLDLVMPEVDGLGVMAALPRDGGPRVVVVSSTGTSTELGVAALAAGAVDLVEKPTTQATDRMYEMADELLERVRFAATVKTRRLPPRRPAPIPVRTQAAAVDAVLVGTSTGGPQALAHLLPSFPADFPVPIVVVVHMPAGYTDALARRLDSLSALTVLEGHEGLVLTRGMAVLAPHGAHLGLERSAAGLRVRLDYLRRPGELHHPSVDALFESGAAVLRERVLGVVMTGMGDDGLRGAGALVTAGARVLVEAESTCVVYGMPRSVSEAGLADAAFELPRLADAIGRRVEGTEAH